MADGTTPRHRFGAIVFGLAVVAALLAVFPATAPAGMILCFLLVVPAIVAVWRARRAPVGARRRSWVALALAPVFFLVGAGVVGTGLPPRPPVTVVAEAAPATGMPLAATPATETAPVPAQDPAVVAPAVAPAAVVPQAVAAPQPVAPQPVVAQPVVAQPVVAKPAAPKAAAAPQPVAAKPAAPKPAPQPVAAAPKPVAGSSCGSNSYINTAGNCVLRPVAAATAPAGATAQCKDGTYSSSQTHSGTCSRHGGVSRWL